MKTRKRTYKPTNLPFLQAQILKIIYSDIAESKVTRLDEISELTDYSKDSKILQNALNALNKKGFLLGSLDSGFEVPDERFELFRKVISDNNYKGKTYSKSLLEFSTERHSNQLELFYSKNEISELNKFGVVHKWYDYLEDFPYTLIEEKIIEYQLAEDSLIVDPFCGSGTTLVSAKMFHIDAIGFDANPLMAFISQVKTNWKINLNEFEKSIRSVAREFLNSVHDLEENPYYDDFVRSMPKREINQWLSSRNQQEVSLLKRIIKNINDVNIRNLFLLALSKSSFDGSYVALCPGTTFYPFREKEEFWDLFSKKIIQIYFDLKAIQNHNHYGESKLIEDTCLNASEYISENSIDFVITSPPYPNDLEYTRQTRLELYLLDFVKNMNDVQEIKRKMAKGSTKLIYKESDSEKYIEKFTSVQNISDKIYEKTKTKDWGFDYPRMVREYFGDMYLYLKEFYPLMKVSSHNLLVVGDQTIKGVFIPVCDILLEMGNEIGYKNCRKEPFRIRRSTGHDVPLPEDIVIFEK